MSEGGTEPLRFAVLSDTHIVPWRDDRIAALRRIFGSIAAGSPHAVIHCGDQTECGSRAELAAYLDAVPPELAPILHNLPGNHEIRWDPTAAGTFTEMLGATEFAFDAGGVRFLGLDPTQTLQEPGLFTPAGLDRLRADLRRAGSATPTLIFLHFPLGPTNYFVNDQDQFLDAIADFNVRGLFAGHIHTEEVRTFNGLTQIACDDAVGAPGYYWVERDGGSGPDLAVTRVAVAADGSETRVPVTTIRLDGTGEGRCERPETVEPGIPDAGTLPVRVTVRPDARVHGVRGQVHPQHRYSAKDDGAWVDFARPDATGTVWTGRLDVSALPPGTHRVAVQVITPEQASYITTARFSRPGEGHEPVELLAVDGSIQAGLAAHGDLLVVATARGEVRCLRIENDGGRPRATPVWETGLGPVHRTPAFTADGARVVVACAGNRLVALDSRHGRTQWTVAVDAPALSRPLVTTIAGREKVLFTSGGELSAVDAGDGAAIWRTDGHGTFVGRAACDGVRVYAGGGDGSAHAYDATSGADLWAFSTNARTDAYHRLIYGPWNGHVQLLPNGLVLVSTVSNAHALDPATGCEVWTVPGSFIYAAAVPTDHGVLLVGERGQVRVSDPDTGAPHAVAETGLRVLDTGACVHGDTAWVLGTTGQLVAIDLPTGTVTGRHQLGTAQSYSSPVLVGDVLATADQAGVLRGFSVDGYAVRAASSRPGRRPGGPAGRSPD